MSSNETKQSLIAKAVKWVFSGVQGALSKALFSYLVITLGWPSFKSWALKEVPFFAEDATYPIWEIVVRDLLLVVILIYLLVRLFRFGFLELAPLRYIWHFKSASYHSLHWEWEWDRKNPSKPVVEQESLSAFCPTCGARVLFFPDANGTDLGVVCDRNNSSLPGYRNIPNEADLRRRVAIAIEDDARLGTWKTKVGKRPSGLHS